MTLLGVWISFEIKSTEIRNHVDVFLDPALLVAIVGIVTFLIGFFGCLGALRENICLLKTVRAALRNKKAIQYKVSNELMTYSRILTVVCCLQFNIFLTIVLLIEFAACAFVFVFYFVPSVRPHVGLLDTKSHLQEAIVRYRDDDDLRDFIDFMQQQVCSIVVFPLNCVFTDQTLVFFSLSVVEYPTRTKATKTGQPIHTSTARRRTRVWNAVVFPTRAVVWKKAR